MFRYLLLTVSFLLAGVAQAVEPEVYKWVDEQGVVHYSERPPEGRECKEMELQEPFTAEEIEEAQKLYKELVEDQSSRRELREQEELYEIKKPHNAGRPRIPLPMNEISVYLETVSTSLQWNMQELYGQFSLVLRPGENLPKQAVLEAHFPNPAVPGKVEVVKAVVNRRESRIHLQSPRLRGFQCQNYQIVVHIYERKDRDKSIGTHYQYIQSIVDLSRVKTPGQLASALSYGNCRDE